MVNFSVGEGEVLWDEGLLTLGFLWKEDFER